MGVITYKDIIFNVQSTFIPTTGNTSQLFIHVITKLCRFRYDTLQPSRHFLSSSKTYLPSLFSPPSTPFPPFPTPPHSLPPPLKPFPRKDPSLPPATADLLICPNPPSSSSTALCTFQPTAKKKIKIPSCHHHPKNATSVLVFVKKILSEPLLFFKIYTHFALP